MLEKHSLIRTIYLYLFTIVGLALVVSGSVKFLDMGLKAFVFTKAEDPERINQQYYYGYSSSIPLEKLGLYYQNGTELTAEEKSTLKSYLEGYKRWQEAQGKVDYVTSTRQREASNNLAMMLVGLPLYLYHWRIIRKETKEKNNQ
jgi:hypothetical protein